MQEAKDFIEDGHGMRERSVFTLEKLRACSMRLHDVCESLASDPSPKMTNNLDSILEEILKAHPVAWLHLGMSGGLRLVHIIFPIALARNPAPAARCFAAERRSTTPGAGRRGPGRPRTTLGASSCDSVAAKMAASFGRLAERGGPPSDLGPASPTTFRGGRLQSWQCPPPGCT